MGFLEDILAQATGAGMTAPPAAHADLTHEILDMLSKQGASGGTAGALSTLSKAFESQGLGSVLSSWVGTGQNLPISGSQVESVLGPNVIARIAQKTGVPPAVAAMAIAAVLPMVVDRLTPKGQAPAQHSMLEDGIALLRSQLAAR